jgi:uncharacterized membrane protein YphA (DoxX/SURF4 family)
MPDEVRLSWWARLWHQPVRAERLALTRILLALALITDQLVQFLPLLDDLYGPRGVAPAGLHDGSLLSIGRLSAVWFHTDDMTVVTTLFWVRVGLAGLLLVGLQTRLVNVLLWVLNFTLVYRSPALINGADYTLMAGLFLLMFAPSGAALSVDRILKVRRARRCGQVPAVPLVEPWSLRLLQLQLMVIYVTTGLAKLIRGPEPFVGTWWDGTSLHYVLNDTTMGRWSFAQLPMPLWLTVVGTYIAVWWETLFPLLVLWRPIRRWTLWFGVVFHLSIYLVLEVGWFSFYTLTLYGVWVPDSFWDRSRPPAV